MIRPMMLDIFTDIYASFMFNLDDMINTNLLVTIIARAVFIFFFVLDHFTLVKGRDTTTAVKESRSMKTVDWAWFVTKEALFIGLGFVHVIFTIAIAGYSLMLAGSHAVTCARRSKYKVNLVFAWIFAVLVKYAVPALGIAAAAVMIALETDPSAPDILYGALIAVVAFSGRSAAALALRKRAPGRELDMETALKAAKRGIAGRTPRIVKLFLLLSIIILPVGLFVYIETTVGITTWTERVMTPDGLELSTDVYRMRSATEPQPVLLYRTPYGKGDISTMGKLVYPLLLDGYTVVLQDQRGRFASTGKFIPFLDDYKDGAYTVSWIKNQSWCNGNIGSFGGSAGAINQYYYADEPTGALKFQSLVIGTPELFDHVAFQGGAFRKGLVETWLDAINDTNAPRRPTEYDDAISWFTAHPVKDAAWNSTSLSMNDRYAGVDVSALHVGGWYDIFSQGTIDGFVGYNYHGGANALGKQRLVMGPIGHGTFGDLSSFFDGASTLNFPDADTSGHAHWEAEMRDAAMKGTATSWSGPCVAYYLMGDLANKTETANKWHYASQWPVPHVNQTYYLHGDQTLGTTPPVANQSRSYLYDPANPVNTKGGNNLNQITSLEIDALGLNGYTGDKDPNRVENFEGIGPYDQQRAGNLDRGDVVVFETGLLATPVTVVGRVTVNLWVASNCTDTAFTAMLLDRYPDGRCYNVLDGIRVMRYREGYDHVAGDLVGSQYYRVSIDLWSTAYQFNSGHKIGIAISSSNYPRFERHPNNSLPFTNHPDNFNVANNTILCGTAIHNSEVVLPTVAL